MRPWTGRDVAVSLLAVWLLSSPLACKADRCESEAVSAQIDVKLADPSRAASTQSLRVSVIAAGNRRRRSYDVASSFRDGETSIAVALDPAPADDFELEVRVEALDQPGGQGQVLAAGSARATATPDGCNQLQVTLAGGAPDGGVVDGGFVDGAPVFADAEPFDGVVVGPDAIPAPDAVPGAEVGPVDLGPTPDGGVVFPDATPPADAGPAVDSGLPFAPSNFNPSQVPNLGPAAVDMDCGGVVTFDSSTAMFDRACGAAPAISRQTQPQGPELVILTMRGLTIGGGTTLRLVGASPVVLDVRGPATINGVIDASGRGTTPGAGGNALALTCGEGGSPSVSGSGGGGGGFGGNGAGGGQAANGDQGGPGGMAVGAPSLTPLRGGCQGGRGGGSGAGQGGAGGGAVQISAAGELRINGSVIAGGGGGAGADPRRGGGGGGSGGGILLEAGRVRVDGELIANGGGGAEGGAIDNGAPRSDPGDDALDLGPAAGGSGGQGGNGGRGGASGDPPEIGENGPTDRAGGGGGGGGGGVGRIRINAVNGCDLGNGDMSPGATSNGAPGC